MEILDEFKESDSIFFSLSKDKKAPPPPLNFGIKWIVYEFRMKNDHHLADNDVYDTIDGFDSPVQVES